MNGQLGNKDEGQHTFSARSTKKLCESHNTCETRSAMGPKFARLIAAHYQKTESNQINEIKTTHENTQKRTGIRLRINCYDELGEQKR